MSRTVRIKQLNLFIRMNQVRLKVNVRLNFHSLHFYGYAPVLAPFFVISCS